MAETPPTRSRPLSIEEIVDAALSTHEPGMLEILGSGAAGIGRGLLDVGRGMGQSIADLSDPAGAALSRAQGFAQSATPQGLGGAPMSTVGRPATVEEAQRQPSPVPGMPGGPGANALNEILMGIPGMAQELLQAAQPRFSSQPVQGPMQPGQRQPFATQQSYQPNAADIAGSVGHVVGEAAPLIAGPILNRMRGAGSGVEDLGYTDKYGGSPGPPIDVTDLNAPGPRPGPFDRTIGTGKRQLPGTAGRAGGPTGGAEAEVPGTYRVTIRMGNGKHVQVDVDAASEVDAVKKLWGTAPPDVLKWLQKQATWAFRTGEAVGQDGFRPVSGFGGGQGMKTPGQGPGGMSWEDFMRTWTRSQSRARQQADEAAYKTAEKARSKPRPTEEPSAAPSPPEAPAKAPETDNSAPAAVTPQLGGSMTVPGFEPGTSPAKPGIHRVLGKFKGEKKYSQHRDIYADSPEQAVQKVTDALPVGYRSSMEFEAKFVSASKEKPGTETKPTGPPPGKTPTLGPARSVTERNVAGYKPGTTPAPAARGGQPIAAAKEAPAPKVAPPEAATRQATSEREPKAPAAPIGRKFSTRKPASAKPPAETEPVSGVEDVLRDAEKAKREAAEPPKVAAAAQAARAGENLGTAAKEPRRGGIETLSSRDAGGGRVAKLKTPNRDYEIRYEEVPLSSLIPSHRFQNFEPNPDYPFEQQRDYTREKHEQAKVLAYARDFQSDFFFADLPTATDGPPVVSPEGYVLGGNGRTMALLRAIQDGAYTKEQLAAAVADARPKYGIKTPHGGDEPTIVVRRVVEKLDKEGQRRATKDLNEDFKQAIGRTSDAIARARNLSSETVKFLADALQAEPEKSLRDLLAGDGEFYKNTLRRLSEDDAISSPELPRFMDERTGRLNEEGLRMVEDVALGRVIKNPNLLRTMKPAPRLLFTAALSELVRAEAAPPAYRITADVVNGLSLFQVAEKSGLTIGDQLEQGNLIPEISKFLDAVRDNQVATTLAYWIEDNVNRPTALRKALAEFNAYVADAVGDQGSLGFVEKLDPHEAFNRAFGSDLSPEEFGSGDDYVSLYAGLPFDALKKAIYPKLTEQGRRFADWLLTPTDVKSMRGPGTLEERIAASIFPKTGDSFRRSVRSAFNRFLAVAMQNRTTRHFPYFHEQMDQFTVDRQNASVEILEDFARMMEPISHTARNGRRVKRPARAAREMFVKLNWLIYSHNEWIRAENGLLTPHHGETWAKGMKQEDVAAALRDIAERARREAPAEVLEAWKRGTEIMRKTREELEARGKLEPLDRFKEYYWPNVFDDYTWQQSMYLYPKSPLRIKEAGRLYVKQAMGTIRQHQPNALLSGIRHVLSVRLDNILDDFAEGVARTWDVTDDILKQAHEQKIPLENVRLRVPGYRLYTVKRGAYGWRPLSVEEFKVQQVLRNDPDLPADIQTLADLVKDRRGRYLIREEIAAQLDHFRAPRGELDAFAGDIAGAVRWWKSWLLSSLGTYFQLTNMVGDLQNVLRLPGWDKVSLGGVKIPIPSGVAAFAHMPQAARDALQQVFGDPSHPDVFRRHGPVAKPLLEMLGGKDPSKTAQRALQLGVTQQTYAVAELWDLRKHHDLDVFFRPARGAVTGTAGRALEIIDKAFTWQRLATQARESVPRQMVWLYLLSKHLRAKRAERISGELLVDYRNADAITSFLRNFAVMPFITFYRQMFPGWARSAFAARLGKKGESPGGGGIAPPNEPPPGAGNPVDWPYEELSPEEAAKGLPKEMRNLPFSGEPILGGLKWFLMVYGVPMLGLWMWNSIMHKELDEQVDEWTKLNMTYAIIGQTKDGRPIIVAFTSPADLFFGSVGASNPIGRIARVKRGFDEGDGGRAIGRQAFESAVAPVSTMAGLLGPMFAYARAADDMALTNWKQLQLEDPQLDKKIDEMFSRLVREQTPYVRQLRAVTRQDLEEEPAWFPFILSPSPFSLLVKVPYTDEELKRIYGRDSGGRVGGGMQHGATGGGVSR